MSVRLSASQPPLFNAQAQCKTAIAIGLLWCLSNLWIISTDWKRFVRCYARGINLIRSFPNVYYGDFGGKTATEHLILVPLDDSLLRILTLHVN